MEGGTYTCRVPPAESCLNGNNTGEATVMVDKMEARFAVMEGRQVALEARNEELQGHVNSLESVLKRMCIQL